MQDRIKVIALDINKSSKNYEDYQQLSAAEKIDLLYKTIDSQCAELLTLEKTTHEPAMWIVGWREYGVTEADSRFLSNETKAAFKKKMLELTKKYPQLVIIAGTVAAKKHFDSFTYVEKLSQLEKEYKLHQENIVKREAKIEESPSKMLLHLQKVQALKENKSIPGIDIVSNTCYVFQGDSVQRHLKTTPYIEETFDLDKKDRPHIVFRPGEAKTSNPLFTLTHPITKKPVKINVEICREHALNIAKEQADLHFVLSDGTDLMLSHFKGDYVIQLDSLNQPQLIQTTKENKNISLYQFDLTEKNSSLMGPLKSFYPMALDFVTQFNDAIKKFPESHPKKIILQKILDRFLLYANSSVLNVWMYAELENQIEENYLKLCDFEDSPITGFGFFDDTKADLKPMLDEILGLISREEAKQYINRTVAPSS